MPNAAILNVIDVLNSPFADYNSFDIHLLKLIIQNQDETNQNKAGNQNIN